MNEMTGITASDPRIEYWRDRIILHHGDDTTAIEAQMRQAVQELGEAFTEWGNYMGHNPRKPVDNTARARFRHECSDVVITMLILMAIDDHSWMHHLNQKLSATVERMRQFDRSVFPEMFE